MLQSGNLNDYVYLPKLLLQMRLQFMQEHLVSKCACDVRKQSESSILRLFVAEELDMQKQNGRTGPYAVSENAKL